MGSGELIDYLDASQLAAASLLHTAPSSLPSHRSLGGGGLQRGTTRACTHAAGAHSVLPVFGQGGEVQQQQPGGARHALSHGLSVIGTSFRSRMQLAAAETIVLEADVTIPTASPDIHCSPDSAKGAGQSYRPAPGRTRSGPALEARPRMKCGVTFSTQHTRTGRPLGPSVLGSSNPGGDGSSGFGGRVYAVESSAFASAGLAAEEAASLARTFSRNASSRSAPPGAPSAAGVSSGQAGASLQMPAVHHNGTASCDARDQASNTLGAASPKAEPAQVSAEAYSTPRPRPRRTRLFPVPESPDAATACSSGELLVKVASRAQAQAPRRLVLERLASHVRAAVEGAAAAWEAGLALHRQRGFVAGAYFTAAPL
jgi:hypothetical protein